jgi:hypothetical protein
MRQAGKVLRFWISVLSVVIGLQSACVAAGSDQERPGQAVQSDQAAQPDQVVQPDQAVQAEDPRPASPTDAAAAAPESSGEPAVQPSEVATPRERDRDHSARSPQEMLWLFLKGAGALTVLVLIYKGLKRRFGPKQQSE